MPLRGSHCSARFRSGGRVKGLVRPAAPQGRGHGPLTRPQRPQASVMRCRGAFPPGPLTTEGDSLPSLARGGGEWWARSALLLVASRQIQRGVLSGALRLGGRIGWGVRAPHPENRSYACSRPSLWVSDDYETARFVSLPMPHSLLECPCDLSPGVDLAGAAVRVGGH